MEGGAAGLEIDSELVMSFYDQYQADDLACKVYGVDPVKGEVGVGRGSSSQHSSSVIELKAAALPEPDVMAGEVVRAGAGEGGHTVWNLPDLLVGLDGITARPPSECDLSASPPGLGGGDSPRAGDRGSEPQYYYDSYRQQTDSLLEGLGILTPPHLQPAPCPAPGSTVKTELCGSPGHSQYNMTDSPITMDLTPLVAQHNIPQSFELNLSPKSEQPPASPGCTSIPISSSFSFSNISNISNISSVSIANIDLLSKSGSPLSLDLIAQHCTLLPSELVSLSPHTGNTDEPP